jgi:intracellular sulfur oxidation DsrE/DsrF family protein
MIYQYQPRRPTMADYPSTVILVTHDGMGSATAPLQHRLLKNYLTMLLDNEMIPTAICFYGEGVRMVIDSSPVLEELHALQEKGVHLVVCNTCLNYYDHVEQRAVGIAGSMADIVEAQWQADKVITL